MLAIFFWKASRPHGQYSNRHATQHSALEFPQVGLHVDDLVLAVHFAQEEVLRAVGVNSEGSGHGAVLVGAGVVVRMISSSRTKGRRDLERSAAVCGWGVRVEPTLRGQAAMEFLASCGVGREGVRSCRASRRQPRGSAIERLDQLTPR